MSDLSERDLRHNILALGADYVAFALGTTLLGPATLLPAFLQLLGASPLAIGSLSAINNGLWLLPQLAAGRYVANRPLVKKHVLLPGVAGRAILLLLLPALYWLVPRAPRMAAAAILLAFAAFIVFDALASVGWFELINKVLPAQRRGRLLGAFQSLASLLAMGAGVLVSAILARPGPLWANHVLVIVVATAFYLIGPVVLALLREPVAAVQSLERRGWSYYLPRLASILRGDRRFVWLTVVRWLSGLADMAAAFYILYAADRLHLPQETTGLFVSAGVAGNLLCGMLLGPLADRKGSVRTIVVVMLLRCLVPALALTGPLFAAHWPQLALGAFVLLFVAMGMANSATTVSFFHYLLAIAPPGETPTYTALANTLGGVLVVAPLLAGWLVQVVSYEFVFALALAVAALGLATALRGPREALPATRP